MIRSRSETSPARLVVSPLPRQEHLQRSAGVRAECVERGFASTRNSACPYMIHV